jgi:hypothetical protein
MTGGRRDPADGIAHVFLFFYALEHGMLVERGERPPFTAPAYDSFLSVATKLLENVGSQFLSVASCFL